MKSKQDAEQWKPTDAMHEVSEHQAKTLKKLGFNIVEKYV